MSALGLCLAYAGFMGLCLAMERHHEQVFGSRRIPVWRGRLLRIVGWLLLALSLLPVVLETGWAVGIVLWAGLLTAAGVSLAFLLPYAPRMAIALALSFLPVTLFMLHHSP